jgi:microcystin-dependent protein
MPSTVCPDAFDKTKFSSSVCDLLKMLLLTNDRLKEFFNWMFNTSTSGVCTISERFAEDLVDLLPPIGSGFWAPFLMTVDSDVWVICDGEKIPRDKYKKLFEAFGGLDIFRPSGTAEDLLYFYKPNLQGRFMLCNGRRLPDSVEYIQNKQGGADTLDLAAQLLNHTHGFGVSKTSINSDTTKPQSDWVAGGVEDVLFLRNGNVLNSTEHKFDPYGATALDCKGEKNEFLSYSNITRTDLLTTVPLQATTPDAQSNMPPYHVGVYYMRANHKINGKLVP